MIKPCAIGWRGQTYRRAGGAAGGGEVAAAGAPDVGGEDVSRICMGALQKCSRGARAEPDGADGDLDMADEGGRGDEECGWWW